jgi:hypothetical protein
MWDVRPYEANPHPAEPLTVPEKSDTSSFF